jgi:hypothetical protein
MTGTAPASPGSTPGGLNVFWRFLKLGLAGAALTFASGMSGGRFGWYQLPAFFPVAIVLALSGWASHRVWSASLAPMLRGRAGWKVELTRIPFWFMAGGMGTVTGMLIGKEYLMLDIRDIPVRPLFTSGANAYTAIQIIAKLIAMVAMRRKFR